MKKKLNYTGKYSHGTKINYLSILKYTQEEIPKKVLCRCDCGKDKEFYLTNITPRKKGRYTKSCGCKKSFLTSEKNTIHGQANTKFYKRWRSMFDRISPKYICSKDYIGVTVSIRWNKFENFRSDMYASYLEHVEKFGERQTTLDRINPFGNYKKSNCRWATFKEQVHNRKSDYYKNIIK